MIHDRETFSNVATWLASLDSDGTRYSFDVDVKRNNGEVSHCHFRRLSGADTFRDRIGEIAKDSSVYSVLVRVFNGQSVNAGRFNPNKGAFDPDYVIQIANPAEHAPPATPPMPTPGGMQVVSRSEIEEQRRRLEELAKMQEQVLMGLMGVGDPIAGHSPIHAAKSLIESRIECERGAMELANLREKLGEARRRERTLEGTVERLERENRQLEDQADGFEERIRELERYDVHQPGGMTNMAVHVGSLALGNLISGYARRNPAKVAGLFGVDALEMLGGVDPTTTQPVQPPAPQPEAYRNPRIPQIISWLRSLDDNAVDMLYHLVKMWDEEPRNLRIMYGWTLGETAGSEGHEGNEGDDAGAMDATYEGETERNQEANNDRG